MNYISTRGSCPPVSAAVAIITGLAPDGGLYVPESFPSLSAAALDPASPYAARAAAILAPFFRDDPLEERIPAICADAFNFPVPLGAPAAPLRVLELFHGPTAAFKDFGARFLAHCMEALADNWPGHANLSGSGQTGAMPAGGGQGRPMTILVATSGDTGGAVAAAFHGRQGLAVRVLFPEGGVSARQRKQLTCWDGNVRSYAVRGTFDDCQRLVKAAFRSTALANWRLSSANSINLGRLLPQAAYHVHAAVRFKAETGLEALMIIPSGNVGNAVAAYWAKAMGAPIRGIVMATNANSSVPDFISSGEYQPRPSIATIANAMDVGDPSNLERLRFMYPELSAFRRNVTAISVDDDQLRQTIRQTWQQYRYMLCPHTAAAEFVRSTFYRSEAAIVVATAHPAKFETVVEPLIGVVIPVPVALQSLLDAPSHCETIDPDLDLLFP